MDKKIFFFDFDGTLRIEETNQITKHTYQSFKKLKELGYILFLNTGRSFNALGELVYTLPFDGFVCGCGTYIRYNDQVLLEAKLSDDLIQEVLDCLEKYQVEAYFEGHKGLFCNKITSDYMKGQIDSIEERGIKFLDTNDPTFHFVKMSVHYPDNEARINFENEMNKYFDFIIRNDNETEVILKGYSKGTAMKFLLKYFQIKKQDSYAFGDNNNDEEMLLSAGNSILIGNQAKHLVNKVTFVSKEAKYDGVTYALEELNIIPKEEEEYECRNIRN